MNSDYTRNSIIEVDFFGVVGIRFENISIEELTALADNYLPFINKIDREPDIVVRFVEEIDVPGAVHLGLDFAAFDENYFLLFSDSSELKKVIIPFEKIGDNIEIICERGITSFPLLNQITNFYFIKKNYVPVHAAAVHYKGKGILAMGWAKGGKTETLLSFARHGAEYIGDEWVVLSNDGSKMFGLHDQVTIWQWQLPYISKLIGNIGLSKRLIVILIDTFEVINRLSIKLKLNKYFPFNILSKSLPQIRDLSKIRISPDILFKDKTYKGKADINIIVLTMSYLGSKSMIEECPSSEVINRMMHSNDFEQLPFFECYRKFKYAFPKKINPFLENIKEKHSALLKQALNNKKTYKFIHPYPVSFEKLFTNVSKIL